MKEEQSWSDILIEIDETRERIKNVNKQLDYFRREKSEHLAYLGEIKKRAAKMKSDAESEVEKLALKLDGLTGGLKKIEDYETE